MLPQADHDSPPIQSLALIIAGAKIGLRDRSAVGAETKMGESKRPLYAYVDETGNTGHNIFDETQPDFFTAALITRGDFDIGFSSSVKTLASSAGVSALHGKELGTRGIETISQDFLKILRAARAQFHVSRVEKKYLLAAKVFDSIFDSGENAGVAWYHYNIKPFRLILMGKVAHLLDEDTAKLFWKCILEHKEENARIALVEVCNSLLLNMDRIPDERSREVLSEGLEWARDHPESIQIHVDKRIARQGHFPNMVAFGNLLSGLESHSKTLRKPVARITHDKQGEFEKTLKAWHDLFANASPEEIRWAGETYSLQKVAGSQFKVTADEHSPGIQVADVILWLYSQFRKDKPLPVGCREIIGYVFENGWENDFSFDGVQRMYIEKYEPMLTRPLSSEAEMEGRAMIHKMEEAKARSIAQYEIDKVPPFMRSAAPIIEHE